MRSWLRLNMFKSNYFSSSPLNYRLNNSINRIRFPSSIERISLHSLVDSMSGTREMTRERTRERASRRERERVCLRQSIDFLFPGTCFEQPMKYFHQSMVDVPWSTSVTYIRGNMHASKSLTDYHILLNKAEEDEKEIRYRVACLKQGMNSFSLIMIYTTDATTDRRWIDDAQGDTCINQCIPKWVAKKIPADRHGENVKSIGPNTCTQEQEHNNAKTDWNRLQDLHSSWSE